MGDVVPFGPRTTGRAEPPPPPARVPPEPLDALLDRAEAVVGAAIALRRLATPEGATLGLASDGAPQERRSWSVVERHDGRRTRTVHGPVPADRIDGLAAAVREGGARWAEALTRRLALHVVE